MNMELWQGLCKLSLFGAFIVFNALVASFGDSAFAQITPDSSLGNESSTVTPNVNIKGSPGTLIEGGATRNLNNLFHSFTEFNVNNGQRVYFSNPAAIENIFTRVTGGNVSNILGTLGVDGNANLFFLNPNGIIFGKNASLDVAGSFFATTADSFDFGNGLQFSATNPQAAPLLTMSVAPGLQYGANPGNISSSANLTVGKDLAIASKNLDLQGELKAGEDITLEALDNTKLGDLNTSDSFSMSTSNSGSGDTGDITINTQSLNMFNGLIKTDTSGSGNAGDININAINSIFLANASKLVTNTFDSGNAGNITTNTQNLTITGGSRIESNTFGAGNAGTITVKPFNDKASSSVTISGIAPFTKVKQDINGNLIADGGFSSGLFASTENSSDTTAPPAAGSGGDIIVNIGNLKIQDEGVISARSRSSGDGGKIDIDVNKLDIIDGGQILTPAFSTGKGGEINITATDDINVSGFKPQYQTRFQEIQDAFKQALIASGKTELEANLEASDLARATVDTLPDGSYSQIVGAAPSQLASSSFDLFGGTGGGNINITSTNGSVFFDNNAEINSSISGGGKAGDITINADGVKRDNEGKPIFDNEGNLIHTGTGGTIAFDTNQITSRVQVGAKGEGGSITLNANGNVIIKNSGLGTDSRGGKENGGNLTINADGFLRDNQGKLIYKNGNSIPITANGLNSKTYLVRIEDSELDAGTFSEGNAGNITINATKVEITDRSELYSDIHGTSTESTQGGTITINAASVDLTDGSFLQTSAEEKGTAGDIILNLTDNLTVSDGSFLDSNSEGEGSAGNIIINVDGVQRDNEGNPTFDNKGNLIRTDSGGTVTFDGFVDRLDSEGNLILDNDGNPIVSGASSSVRKAGVLDTVLSASAGNITLNVNGNVTFKGGSSLKTDTEGIASAGNITINADGLLRDNQGNLIRKDGNPISIGSGGKVTFDGFVPDNEGNPRLDNDGNPIVSGVSSGVEGSGTGFAGNIQIAAKSVLLNNSAKIATDSTSNSSSSSEKTGNIGIEANRITLSKNAEITAETASSDGGDIALKVKELLLMQDSSNISTSAGTKEITGTGKGGNITINAPNGFIVANPNENNDIEANAFSGGGGKVEIEAVGVYFIEPLSRNQLDAKLREKGINPDGLTNGVPNRTARNLETNDITAISTQGSPQLDGLVNLNTPDVDPGSSINTLPQDVVDPSNLIAQGCDTFDEEGSEFTVTGRGGLPPSPEEPFSSDGVWEDMRLQDVDGDQKDNKVTKLENKKEENSSVTKITPATSWEFNKKGEVTLLTHASNSNPYKLGSASQGCRKR